MIDNIIKNNLLDLTREERAHLASILLESLTEGTHLGQPLTDGEWEKELERRIAEHKRNPESAIEWDAVKEKARAIIG